MASSEDPKHGRPQRRAVGIVRVSRVSGRDGESFASPDEQRQRIEVECERKMICSAVPKYRVTHYASAIPDQGS